MPEPRPAEDRVLVAVHDRVALVRVAGRGTFKVSAALKEFGQSSFAAGCYLIAVDMADCSGMDSTFMGVLAGLAGRARHIPGGGVVLLNMNDKTRNLVAVLGLDQVLQVHLAGQTPAECRPFLALTEAMTSLATQTATAPGTAETMLEAHENLVHISPDNLPRFKDVLTYLREDLRRQSGGGAPPP